MRAVSERRRLRFFWWASVKAPAGRTIDLAVEGAARAPVEDPLVVLLAPAVRAGRGRRACGCRPAARRAPGRARRASRPRRRRGAGPSARSSTSRPPTERTWLKSCAPRAEVGLGRPEVVRLGRLLLERRVVEVGVRRRGRSRSPGSTNASPVPQYASTTVACAFSPRETTTRGWDATGPGAPVGDVDDEERLGEDDAVGDVDEGAVEEERRVHRDEGVREVSARGGRAASRGGRAARRRGARGRRSGRRPEGRRSARARCRGARSRRRAGGASGRRRRAARVRRARREPARGRGPRGRSRRRRAVRRACTDEVRQTPGDRRDARVAPLLVGGAGKPSFPSDSRPARRRFWTKSGLVAASRAPKAPGALDDGAGPLREGRRQDRGRGRGAQDAVPAPTAASSSSQP